jgi:hypothetical protein
MSTMNVVDWFYLSFAVVAVGFLISLLVAVWKEIWSPDDNRS